MVDVQFPSEPDEEYISLIPDQRMTVARLMDKGVITGYALSADRTHLWMMVSANTERQVWEVLQKMPLYRYMNVIIEELAFNESYNYAVPQPSLN